MNFVPVETAIGVLINTTDWIHIVDLNTSTHLAPWIHHGIEFFRTPFLEIPWRLIDHGYVHSRSRILWYVLPVGTSTGLFYFVAPDTETPTEAVFIAREGLRHLLVDDAAELGTFVPPINGEVSIDGFIGRMLDQEAWLIYNALYAMIPGYMKEHSITKASISNRKHRCIRMQKKPPTGDSSPKVNIP